MRTYDNEFAGGKPSAPIATISLGAQPDSTVEAQMCILNEQALRYYNQLTSLEREITNIVYDAFGVVRQGDDWDTNDRGAVELVKLLATRYKDLRDEPRN